MARRRIAKKKRKTKQGHFHDRLVARGLEGLLAIFVLFGLSVAFVAFVRSSPRFEVRTIVINGTEQLRAMAVRDASGLTRADNVFFVDIAAVRERVEAMPLVESCRIEVTYPDTVSLYVKERRPIASLIVGRRSFEMDAAGIVLRQYASDEVPREPFISMAPGLEFIEPGQHVEHPAVMAALEVWAAFSGTEMSRSVTVSELSAEHADNLRMYCNEFAYPLVWGRGNFKEQARRLDSFWKQEGERAPCSQYLDLRFGNLCICL
jgi:cell division protein FtsQ